MTKDFDIYLKMLKEKYPPSKLTISLDTNFDASDSWNGNGYLKTVLPYVDILFPNELEAQGIANQLTSGDNASVSNNPNEALEILCRLYPNCLFIVTIGEGGVIAGKGEVLRLEVPIGKQIKKEDILDTTGAGDSFAASFLFEYLVQSNLNNNGDDNNNRLKDIVQNSCQIGNIGGGICVTQHGAVSKHYTYDELKFRQGNDYSTSNKNNNMLDMEKL